MSRGEQEGHGWPTCERGKPQSHRESDRWQWSTTDKPPPSGCRELQTNDSGVPQTIHLHQAVGNLERARTPAVGKNPGKQLHIFSDDRNVDYLTGLSLDHVQVVWIEEPQGRQSALNICDLRCTVSNADFPIKSNLHFWLGP